MQYDFRVAIATYQVTIGARLLDNEIIMTINPIVKTSTLANKIPRFSTENLEDAKIFFDNNGFVIFKNFFPADDLVNFKNDVKNIINSYLQKADLEILPTTSDDILTNGILRLENVNHEYVAAIYDTIFQCPSFFRIVGNRLIEQFIRCFLNISNSSPLYGFTNRCRIDPPRDNRRTYGWHQEVFYTVPKGKYIQTWAPLIFNTTVQNGTIEVACGSHKEQIAKQTWTEAEGKATQIIVDSTVVDKYEQQAVEMEIGEILFFSGFLAHRSGNNTSNQVRYSLVGMYHDVNHKDFFTPKIQFSYRKGSPKEYFNETFGA